MAKTSNNRMTNSGTPVRKAGVQANQRGIARLNAVQSLYQMDVGGTSLGEVRNQFIPRLSGVELEGETYLPGDADFFDQVLSGVLKNQLTIDPQIELALSDDWPVGRIDATLRAILRAGTFELMFRPDIPSSVVVSEYIDVAKAFFGGDVPGMVNAVLDRIAGKVPAKEKNEAKK